MISWPWQMYKTVIIVLEYVVHDNTASSWSHDQYKFYHKLGTLTIKGPDRALDVHVCKSYPVEFTVLYDSVDLVPPTMLGLGFRAN